MNMEEKAYNILATKKKNHRDMAITVPDRKASGDFHRPVYQAATLIRKQGEQMKTESVEEYLDRKYKIGGDSVGNDDKGKTGSVPKQQDGDS